MKTVRIRVIQNSNDTVLDSVIPLFDAMHVEMASQGMKLHLTKDGAQRWYEGIRNGLERFGRLAVAEQDGTVIGFAQGDIKLAPEHLGGARIGHIAHLYVVPEYRRSGCARLLAISLNEWMSSKDVTSIELQVVHGNEAGLAFWGSLGFEPELLQLRKI